jgi:hypothetical protein
MVFRLYLDHLEYEINNNKSSIIWGWYNRPVVASVIENLVPPPRNRKLFDS